MEPSHYTFAPPELERALRRARSTGDLGEPTRPTRHPSGSHRRSEGQAGPSWSSRHSTRAARGELRMPAPLSVGTIPETSSPATSIPIPMRPPRPPEPAYHSPRGSGGRSGGGAGGIQAAWAEPLDVPPEELLSDEDRRATRPPPRGWLGKVLVFFGQAGPNARARSQLISVVWTLGSGVVQVRLLLSPRHCWG